MHASSRTHKVKISLLICTLVLLGFSTPVAAYPPAGTDLVPANDSGEQPQEAPPAPPSALPADGSTGFVPPTLDLSHLKGQWPASYGVNTLPSKLDWREQGKVTPVKNQASCGDCYAFAAVGNFESRLLIDNAGTFDLSENNAKECSYGSPGCGGGNFHQVANLFSQKGAVLESCDPYVASDVECNSSCPPQKTLLDWRIISGGPVPDTTVLKNYIQTYGPIFTSMYASFPGFNGYDGSYTMYYTGTNSNNHAVLIVGWDDSLVHAGGTGGWIVKNSWGPYWGGTAGYGTEKGYFTIAYGSAGIGQSSSFIAGWQDYDATGGLLYNDESGWSGSVGYSDTTAWGMAVHTPTVNTYATRIEFWTTDATTDIDVYLYDDFSGSSLSGLLASKLNMSYNEAGYHSVLLDTPVPLSNGNTVYAVLKVTNASYNRPIAADSGPGIAGRSYISHYGTSWSAYTSRDIAIRIRTSTGGAMGTPASLAAMVMPHGHIGLNWQDRSTDESDFHIERSPDGSTGWAEIATVPAGTSGYDDSELTPLTRYYYRVRGHRHSDDQYTAYSNIVNASTLDVGLLYLPMVLR